MELFLNSSGSSKKKLIPKKKVPHVNKLPFKPATKAE